VTQTWWLSFCDPDRPEGQQFLGVVIVDVDEWDKALGEIGATAIRASHGLPPLTDAPDQWFAAAVSKTHRLHVNPGGEAKGHRVDEIAPPEELARCPRNRLLLEPELDALGVL
jgi:hypothetical protein